MVVTPPEGPRRTALHLAGVVIAVVAFLVAGMVITPFDREWGWFVSMGSLLAIALIAGHSTTGSWRGVLIDTRNKLSLSRLQALAWTVLILSALSTAAFTNIAAHAGSPLAITVPQAVWLLAGIGATSLAASPLIHSVKSTRPPDTEQAARTLGILARRMGGSDSLALRGEVVVNVRAEDARWSDLVSGEEVGNAAGLDLGKLQMLYVSFVLITIYTAALSALFREGGPVIVTLPTLDGGMVALLGVSHAGYIATKAIPQSLPG